MLINLRVFSLTSKKQVSHLEEKIHIDRHNSMCITRKMRSKNVAQVTVKVRPYQGNYKLLTFLTENNKTKNIKVSVNLSSQLTFKATVLLHTEPIHTEYMSSITAGL